MWYRLLVGWLIGLFGHSFGDGGGGGGGEGGGRNSSVGSVLGTLSCVTQRRRLDPALRRIFPVEGIFPLELTWILTPFPKTSFG